MAEDKELTPEQIRDGHIERFKQGVEVWNAWAEEMLREKELLEKAGKWQVTLDFVPELPFEREVSSIPETQNWLNRAFVNFSALHFVAATEVQDGEIEPEHPPDIKSISIATETIDFSNFIFPGPANFYNVTFTGNTYFSDATFTGPAYFLHANFTSGATFRGATFTSDAKFSDATFTGDAYFRAATFSGPGYFSDVTFTGPATFRSATFTGPADFRDATFTSDASFSDATFTSPANFSVAIFTRIAQFSEVNFTKKANFSEATFKSHANFLEASFANEAIFSEATFTGHADFLRSTYAGPADFFRSTFSGISSFFSANFINSASFAETTFTTLADFEDAKFTGPAQFAQADFEGLATFAGSTFQSKSAFLAVKAERGFTLANANFDAAVPGFIQAHFEEAPRLDHISVLPPPEYFHLGRLWHLSKRICQRHYLNSNEPHRIKWRLPRYNLVEWLRLRLLYSWRNFKNHRRDHDEEARYRALKRLAIQAHDHENELEFFAGEIRARRHLTDSPNIFRHGPKSFLRYLAGIAYDIFSDFGRSIWRPLTLFAVIFYAFTQLYIHQATALSDVNCANSDKMTASYAAYTIAAKNSLLFLGTDRTDKIKRAYTCLYGASPIYEKADIQSGSPRFKTGYKNNVSTKRHMAPNVPWAVSVLGTAHSILSLSLIFLLLLAIRNQFKIK